VEGVGLRVLWLNSATGFLLLVAVLARKERWQMNCVCLCSISLVIEVVRALLDSHDSHLHAHRSYNDVSHLPPCKTKSHHTICQVACIVAPMVSNPSGALWISLILCSQPPFSVENGRSCDLRAGHWLWLLDWLQQKCTQRPRVPYRNSKRFEGFGVGEIGGRLLLSSLLSTLLGHPSQWAAEGK
jgi:hypothetical protein